MTQEFQLALLQAMCQRKEFKRYVPDLPSKAFTKSIHQSCMEVIQTYVERYKVLPTQVGLLQLLADELEGDKSVDDAYNRLQELIPKLFLPIQVPFEHLQAEMDGEVTRALSQNELAEAMKALVGAQSYEVADIVSKAKAKLGALTRGSGKGVMIESGGLLTNAITLIDTDIYNIHPTCWKALNSMTSLGGFYSPQLIIFAAAPKSFKTGVMLNLLLGWVRMGLKIYFADTENGEKSIHRRSMQHFLELTAAALHEDYTQFEDMANQIRVCGGDMWVDSYPAYASSVGDMDERLEELKECENFIPDIICMDSIDHFTPTDSSIKDPRHKITAVYFEVINLNKRRKVLTIAPSQVNKAAVGKQVFDMKDLGEDFRKTANCHAAFALCQDPDEEIAGMMRVVPIVQRDGVPQSARRDSPCLLRLDKSKMLAEEITLDDM